MGTICEQERLGADKILENMLEPLRREVRGDLWKNKNTPHETETHSNGAY